MEYFQTNVSEICIRTYDLRNFHAVMNTLSVYVNYMSLERCYVTQSHRNVPIVVSYMFLFSQLICLDVNSKNCNFLKIELINQLKPNTNVIFKNWNEKHVAVATTDCCVCIFIASIADKGIRLENISGCIVSFSVHVSVNEQTMWGFKSSLCFS